MAEREPGHGWEGRPARSGADTPRSTDVVQHGGKVDPNALLKRIQESQAANPAPEEDEDGAILPSLPAAEGDLIVPGAPDDDAPNRVAFVLQRDLNKRLDKYLTDRITFMSRTQLQRLIDEGGVTVNGGRCKASTKLRSGDKVEVYVPPPPPTEIQPENIPLDVLYEDEHLIVINKSPNIIVHPARAHNKGTMINALAWHFQHNSAGGGVGSLSGVGKEFARPGVVHRLDRQTSGLIVFAKSDEAHWRIGQQFERRTVDKRYLALVLGLYEPPIDTIDLPIGPHQSKEKGYREKFVVRHDVLGKQSLTIARVRERFRTVPEVQESVAPAKPKLGWNIDHVGSATDRHGQVAHATPGYGRDARATDGYSLVELELKSGRTHQIRVHLTHRGFPIAGDDMYGGRALVWDLKANSVSSAVDRTPGWESRATQSPLIGRVALHAATLAFKHPADGRPMAFSAPLPSDLLRTLDALREMDKLSVALTPPGATVNIPPRT